MFRKHTFSLATAALFALAGQTTCLAAGSESKDAIEPRVLESLEHMLAYLDDAATLTFTAQTTTEDVSSTLQKLQFDTVMTGSVRRPNKIALERTGAQPGALWFDGTTATVLDRKENKYTRIPVNGTIDDLIAKLDDLDIEAPLAGLLRKDLLKHVRDHAFKGDFYGDAPIGDVKTYHLALRQDAVDWQIWLDHGTYAPRRIVITSKMLAGAPQHTVVFNKLNKNPDIADDAFMPKLPDDAVEVPYRDSNIADQQTR